MRAPPKRAFLGGAVCDIAARYVDTLLGFALPSRALPGYFWKEKGPDDVRMFGV